MSHHVADSRIARDESPMHVRRERYAQRRWYLWSFEAQDTMAALAAYHAKNIREVFDCKTEPMTGQQLVSLPEVRRNHRNALRMRLFAGHL
mmetsp:Transcript_4961/g.14387  ORF Transcript_4961/g.14387 Transcript_4961/m.14387 type:complete len:91 (-) Transcript_4961:3502-3774(-)